MLRFERQDTVRMDMEKDHQLSAQAPRVFRVSALFLLACKDASEKVALESHNTSEDHNVNDSISDTVTCKQTFV